LKYYNDLLNGRIYILDLFGKDIEHELIIVPVNIDNLIIDNINLFQLNNNLSDISPLYIIETIYNIIEEFKQSVNNNIFMISLMFKLSPHNIIINNHGKIKFIDMRGKVGNTNTILGDWLYDWAKLYQSLIGYDKILMNKEIDKNYEDSMIQTFKNYFIETFSEDDFINLKIITNSLLFTLIPLHDNNKCNKYYNLINFT
jgi:hypothetical protein